jgi:DNA-directed RNA polymerase subunit alpha
MENISANDKNWKAMIKPTKLDIQLSEDKTKAKIIAEPLFYLHLIEYLILLA